MSVCSYLGGHNPIVAELGRDEGLSGRRPMANIDGPAVYSALVTSKLGEQEGGERGREEDGEINTGKGPERERADMIIISLNRFSPLFLQTTEEVRDGLIIDWRNIMILQKIMKKQGKCASQA